MVNNVQYGSLHKLRFHNRRHDLHERFFREYDRPFRYSVNVSAKMEPAQIMEEIFTEYPQAPQIIYIFVSKVQVLDVVDDLRQPRAHRIAVFRRVIAEEKVKNDYLVLLLLIVALHHGQLI